jgi:hypothetical protein
MAMSTQAATAKPRRRRRSATTPQPAPGRRWTCGRPDDYLPPWLIVRLDDDAEIALSIRAIGRAGQCPTCTVERLITEGLFRPDPQNRSDDAVLRMCAGYGFCGDDHGTYAGTELCAVFLGITGRGHPLICIHDEAGVA